MIFNHFLKSPPGKVVFWLEVFGVEFRCAFDRIPQWQSHLDGIDIALITMIVTMKVKVKMIPYRWNTMVNYQL